jgi:hypothetical protein
MIGYVEGMQLLREARVFAPAIVEHGGAFHVFSRMTLLGSGATVEDALLAGGFLPRPEHRPPVLFVAVGSNVVRGNEGVAAARSKTMAVRIANALNEYMPGDRGF